jgi:hypothetical protein
MVISYIFFCLLKIRESTLKLGQNLAQIQRGMVSFVSSSFTPLHHLLRRPRASIAFLHFPAKIFKLSCASIPRMTQFRSAATRVSL